ncbi:MAG TPA: hypothetical protein DEF51_13490 [Myxococcales bacterium]|nr:hypothetical protein [Myxococcales bacterium]
MQGEDVVAFFEGSLTPFGGFGIAVAVLLLLLLRLVVPTGQRRIIRAPLVLLVGHLILIVVLGLMPEPSEGEGFAHMARRLLRLTALTLLLLSIARATYLAILHAFLRRGKRRSLPGIFRDIIQVAFYAVVALLVLHAAGVEPGSLLTTSALLTAVIGLSLQDTLGNLFAGLAIQAQTPFEVGDWVQFDDDPAHIGEVLEINWRATRLLTIDRVEVTVPNNLLAKAPIRNYSKPTRLVRRKSTILGPYEAPPARVHRLLAEAVVEVDGVRSHPPPDIQTIDFTERGIEYRVRYFIEDFDQREVIDSRVRDRLWYALRRGALQIPAPQRRITVVEQNAATAEAHHQATIADIERAIAKIELFHPLGPELLHEVAMHTERRLYAHHELVIQQGDYGEELFIVEKGELEVLIDVHDGMQHVATLKRGDFFGEMSLLTGEQRRATVRSDGEVSLFVVSKDSLQPVLEASPDLAENMSAVLAERELALRNSNRPSTAGDPAVTERSGELLQRIREFFSI